MLQIESKGSSYPCASINTEKWVDAILEQGEELHLGLAGHWMTEDATILEALSQHLTMVALSEEGDVSIAEALEDVARFASENPEGTAGDFGTMLSETLTQGEEDFTSTLAELLSMAQQGNTYNQESDLDGAVNYTLVPTSVDNGDVYDQCILLCEISHGDPRGGYGVGRAAVIDSLPDTCFYSPCLDCYGTYADDSQDYCVELEECGPGYHGSSAFHHLIDGNPEGVKVVKDDDGCPVFDGDNLICVNDEGRKIKVSFMVSGE